MSRGPEESSDTTSPARPPSAWTRLAEGRYHRHLAATRGTAVVLFSAPHCGACRRWKQLLPDALTDRHVSFVEVDVSEATGLARYFGIFHLPTIYLYRDGLFHAELQCEARPHAIRQAVADLLQAPAQDEPD